MISNKNKLLFIPLSLSVIFVSINLAGLRDYATPKNFEIGTCIDMNALRNETQYRNTIINEFNTAVAENAFKMYLWTGPNSYNWYDTDYLVNFCRQNNIKLRGHCLVWHSVVPSWLQNGNYSSDQVRTMLENYIKTVVGRYKNDIYEWDVVNEAISDNSPYGLRTDSFWYQKLGQDFIRLAFQWAHEADPDCKLYYNDYGAEGMGGKADGVYNLVKSLVQQGVPIHAVGWQCHFGVDWWNLSENNFENLYRIKALGLDVKVTELDLPLNGRSLQEQAMDYASLAHFCLSNKIGFIMWGFTDRHTWLDSSQQPLIFDSNYNPKPAYYAIQHVLQAQTSGGIYNYGFENDIYCWTTNGSCSISVNTSQKYQGNASCYVSNRSGAYTGVAQYVSGYLYQQGQGQYNVSAWVKLANGADQARITIYIRDDNGNRYIGTQGVNVNSTDWAKVEGTINVTWTGILRVARLYIETVNTSNAYYVDNVSLEKAEATPSSYTLTININPQGAGSVSLNPSAGSYVAGTTVTLAATANNGYVFSSWSGDLTGSQNPATIVMNSNKSVTANFVREGVVAVTQDVLLIDDCDDGDTTNKLGGSWYAFNDSNNNGCLLYTSDAADE